MKVIWTPRAQHRLKKHYDHIAEDQPGNAQRWMARVLARDEQIDVLTVRHGARLLPKYLHHL